MEKSKIAIPVIEKRKLQAEVIIAIYDEMKEAFGEIKAKKIICWKKKSQRLSVKSHKRLSEP